MALVATTIMNPAVAAPTGAAAATPSAAPSAGSATAVPVCGNPAPGEFSCFSMRRTDVKHGLGVQRQGTTGVAPQGYAPADLLSAYNLPAGGGAGATIAIVDAYDDPNAESDLAVYRQQYGLPACTSDNGCFQKVDERGGAAYPDADPDWAGEISLDLDMVSAIAPQAHIILVEADSPTDGDLGAAENTAVALGAEYVSNSWGAYDDSATNLADDEAYFNHPGTAIVFSSGDDGYGVSYPASSQYVTSVGGTALVKDDSARGWSERVWNSAPVDPEGQPHWGATGSGCSAVEPKPTFQADPDCAGRSVADVSAVADPETGVAVYDSYSGAEGWNVYGGTSASAPIIAGVYALAGQPTAGSYPSTYPYERTGALNDVIQGDDASCASNVPCGWGTTPNCTPSYECQAQVGYDGPTGLGTPNGVDAFKQGQHGVVAGTVTDASTTKPVVGAGVQLGVYHVTTDANGHYRLDVPVGSYALKITAFGYAPGDLGNVDITDGATLSKDLALTPVPSATISGTVRDGGQHGWGLYAKITVDGVPGTTFTDPRTGHYSLKLPIDATYQMNVTALYPGYKQASVSIDASTATVSKDVTLGIDKTGTLPPGYRMDYAGGEQQFFDAPSTPAGWTVKNNNDNGGWNFTDPLNRGNQTGGTGHFAEVDDWNQGWSDVDSELISPTYDFSKVTAPELDFDTSLPYTYRLDPLTADVDVSTDGGNTWTNVWEQTNIENGPAHESVSLAKYAGQPSVQVRFHYVGGLTGIWEVDDVQVGQPTLATEPGGLMVGTVTDHNTGAGVLGASVTSLANPDETTQTVASQGDPALPNGLYWLFTSASGNSAFTAGLPNFGYPSVTHSFKVADDAITPADFSLHPADLTFSTHQVAASVPWGQQQSVNVKITNSGSVPATISLGEQGAAPAASAANAAPQLVPSTITPNTAADAAARKSTNTATTTASAGTTVGQSWQGMPNLPAPDFGGIAAVNDGVLYTGLGETPGGVWSKDFYAYDPTTYSWKHLASPVTTRYAPVAGFIRGKLYVVGGRDAAGNGIAGGEVYDAKTDSWSQIASAPYAYGGEGSAVVNDKLYVIGGCDMSGCGNTHVQVYDPASNTWSQGPAYPEQTSYASCGAIEGDIYCAGGAGQPADGAQSTSSGTYALDVATGHWTRKAEAPVAFWGAAGTAANGLLLVAGGQQVTATSADLTNAAYSYDPVSDTWSSLPNLPNPVINAASAPGWYVLGGSGYYSAPQATVQELPGYDGVHGDVPWLSESAKSLTIGAGKSVTVSVTMDATAMGPADAGAHNAALVVDSDTPYGSLRLPVSMNVTPPAGWSLVTGTVSGMAADGTSRPLAGATVTIATKASEVTLRTAEDGSYQLWLPSAGTATVTASADGYEQASRQVQGMANHAVEADFTLSPTS